MKNIAILSVLTSIAAAAGAQTTPVPARMPARPATATTGTTSPVRPVSNPRSIGTPPATSTATATTPATPTAQTVTLVVNYPSIQNTHATLTSPAGAFNCVPPTLPIVTFLVRCTLTVPTGTTTTVQAIWFNMGVPVANNGVQVAGAQWGIDACAGTAGDTCTLTMNADKSVTINPAAPGGIPKPIGTTTDN